MPSAPAQNPISTLSFASAKGALRRIVLYSHDALGFGHLRRNLMLAQRLKAMSPAPEAVLVAGTSEAGAFDLPAGVDLITLPACAKQSCGTYEARRLSMGLAELCAGIIKARSRLSAPPRPFGAASIPLGSTGSRHLPPERSPLRLARPPASRPGRHAEQHLHRPAGPGRGVAAGGMPAPLAGRRACEVIPRSHQIVSAPRRFSASLWARQSMISRVGGVGQLMPSSYRAGFPRRIPHRLCAAELVRGRKRME